MGAGTLFSRASNAVMSATAVNAVIASRTGGSYSGEWPDLEASPDQAVADSDGELRGARGVAVQA